MYNSYENYDVYIDDKLLNIQDKMNVVASYRISLDIGNDYSYLPYVTYYNKEEDIFETTTVYAYGYPSDFAPQGEIVFDFQHNKFYVNEEETTLMNNNTDLPIDVSSVIGLYLD